MVGNHLFVIFAVLDVSCAVNSCINHSFLHLSYITLHLGYKTEFKAKSLFISRTSIHEVAKQQNQLQQPCKFPTKPNFFECCCNCNDILKVKSNHKQLDNGVLSTQKSH